MKWIEYKNALQSFVGLSVRTKSHSRVIAKGTDSLSLTIPIPSHKQL
jgi:hypothetical protein